MDNLNWLVGQSKQLGERLQATESTSNADAGSFTAERKDC
jgi:hypothetical protein